MVRKSSRRLDAALAWGRTLLTTNDLQPQQTLPITAVFPALDNTQLVADAIPSQITISGIIESALQAGLIPRGSGGNGGGGSGSTDLPFLNVEQFINDAGTLNVSGLLYAGGTVNANALNTRAGANITQNLAVGGQARFESTGVSVSASGTAFFQALDAFGTIRGEQIHSPLALLGDVTSSGFVESARISGALVEATNLTVVNSIQSDSEIDAPLVSGDTVQARIMRVADAIEAGVVESDTELIAVGGVKGDFLEVDGNIFTQNNGPAAPSGYVFIPGSNGEPTSTPVSPFPGVYPLYWDNASGTLYVYDAAWQAINGGTAAVVQAVGGSGITVTPSGNSRVVDTNLIGDGNVFIEYQGNAVLISGTPAGELLLLAPGSGTSIRESGVFEIIDTNIVGQGDITVAYNDTQIVLSGTAGAGSPGGNNNEVQFNDNGSFGGNSAFTFDDGGNGRLDVNNVRSFLNEPLTIRTFTDIVGASQPITIEPGGAISTGGAVVIKAGDNGPLNESAGARVTISGGQAPGDRGGTVELVGGPGEFGGNITLTPGAATAADQKPYGFVIINNGQFNTERGDSQAFGSWDTASTTAEFYIDDGTTGNETWGAAHVMISAHVSTGTNSKRQLVTVDTVRFGTTVVNNQISNIKAPNTPGDIFSYTIDDDGTGRWTIEITNQSGQAAIEFYVYCVRQKL